MQPEYTRLIKKLLRLTKENKSKWLKGDSVEAYYIIIGKYKIIIDKYYSFAGNKPITSVDITLFDNETNEIINEIVKCSLEEYRDGFDKLHELYNVVVVQFNKEQTEALSPIINKIINLLEELSK